jgi:hypothetical protein
MPGRAPRPHRDRHAFRPGVALRFRPGRPAGDRDRVAACTRLARLPWQRAVRLRRNDPALSAMGLEGVFLSARPIVESLARSTMPSSTTLFSNNRKVQRTRPLRGLEQPGRSAWLPSRHRKSAQLRSDFPLWRHSEHGRIWCWVAPVAINPTATWTINLLRRSASARKTGGRGAKKARLAWSNGKSGARRNKNDGEVACCTHSSRGRS